MPSAIVLSSNGPHAPPLSDDLIAAGIEVLGTSDCTQILHDVIKKSPDIVVFYEETPGPELFQGTAGVRASAPRPVVVFTSDPDAEKIALATRSGIHAYVVNGYSQNRLRSVIHLAQARFRYDQLLIEELAAVNQRFAERKLIDRARGILMATRQLREEEAYRALRTAAMHAKQRIGQVAQHVIDSARYAEAINRAGQLRMLSQRLVKLYALTCAQIRLNETKGLFADSIGQVENNLGILRRTMSKATFGDLLDAVEAPWKDMQTVLAAPAQSSKLQEIDRLAERFLQHAEKLTLNLEIAGFAAALHVINVAGRQRMLSQRLAKSILLSTMFTGKQAHNARAAAQRAELELIEGLEYLDHLSLSNAKIDSEVSAAKNTWGAFKSTLSQDHTEIVQDKIAVLSEALLAHFEVLTDLLERGMQALIY